MIDLNIAAHDAARSIGHYCSTRFRCETCGTYSNVTQMLDIPLFADVIERECVGPLRAENERLKALLKRAVVGLKCVGKFHYEPGDDPHSLDCSLAGRVSRVFCCGMTRAIELCREFGCDPYHKENEGKRYEVQKPGESA